MDILVVLFRWIHIGAAAYWVAVGFVEWQTLRADASMQAATWIAYKRQLGAVSKLALGMPVSAILTVVGGVVLYGIEQYWNRGFGSLGSIVFHIGVVAGLLAFGHGASAISKSSDAIANALKGAGDSPTADQIAAVQAAVDKQLRQLPAHFALAAVAFLCMVAGTTIA
ncbi:MAG: hypothetical protein IT298_11590 [Chloroflexi bacterium]|jgi:hypothetical protein|nr:MAG: hypothetical protein UZ13_02222 [Chloroflexi bacterium OLB13]MBC6954751.1 hypothetical protein [Chloroflexota bacterium]MBV6436369.1 hypothetical protein [Anaerolineae bacterium]MDL1914946.1 hypothetical protein [Anaerolineae bacterium CFX4]OQY84103.1 MAG: hypothetical protein B6D42_06060 [Anaerolineae bacterium UTCFX5]